MTLKNILAFVIGIAIGKGITMICARASEKKDESALWYGRYLVRAWLAIVCAIIIIKIIS